MESIKDGFRIVTIAGQVAFGVGLSALSGCGSDNDDPEAQILSSSLGLIGDTLPGFQADADLLEEAREAFSSFENINDGVGPVFNANSCATCHSNGATGGAGEQIEQRMGRFVGGVFDGLANRDGTLRQLFTVANFNNQNLPPASRGICQPGNPTLCCVPLETIAPEATVTAGRRTQPLFGLGLVDAMPNGFFDALAASQPTDIRGTVRRVPVLIPNPGDPSQSIGSMRVARFGWKGNVPSLLQFAADAYLNEMAITTQSCFRGQPLNAFAVESAPNGVPVPDGCDDLAERQTDPNPGGLTNTQWAQVDDAVGSCAGNRTEIQDDVFLFAVFMTSLAPPERDNSGQPVIARGGPLFNQVGCNGCHVSAGFVTPANPAPLDIGNGEEVVRVPGNFAFSPYSDFLLHDMGSLGDRIGAQSGESEAQTRQMRTQPLWGNRFQNKLLHDGRCSDINCAIQAHDGQAATARNAYNALSADDRHALTQFVRSL